MHLPDLAAPLALDHLGGLVNLVGPLDPDHQVNLVAPLGLNHLVGLVGLLGPWLQLHLLGLLDLLDPANSLTVSSRVDRLHQ